MVRWFLLCLAISLLSFGLAAKGAEDKLLKVGVVDLNRALNDSDAGRRSKKILLHSRDQKESELKTKEKSLKKLAEEVRNNIMLTEAARAGKEKEVRERRAALQKELRKAQLALQDQERKHTESIFAQLRTVIALISKEENFDFVVEQNAARSILYTRHPLIDITDKTIERYNDISK